MWRERFQWVAMIGAAAILSVVSCAPTPGMPEEDDTSSFGVHDQGDSLVSFAAQIPEAAVRDLDLEMALTLVAMPLSCLDRPHAAPNNRGTYLDTISATRRPGYEGNRAFYGCWDWHSAVNSTWMLVRIQKDFPDLPISGLVTEKLASHLSEAALLGEFEFFEGSRTFERPYGWAWLLNLYAELRTWEHPDAEGWGDRLEPLATLFSERIVDWLPDLKRPSRTGVHGNTAFSLAMMLDAARRTRNYGLERAIVDTSIRLFGNDVDCPTAYEPWASDFLSPCLEEAALMASVFEPSEYALWFDDFLPPVTSREFMPLLSPVDPTDVVEDVDAPKRPSGSGDQAGVDAENDPEAAEQLADDTLRALASTSHLIGLAFLRADAMNRIVAALPQDDPRIEVYRKLAILHGAMGFDAMFEADYAGSHWLGTFALKYLLTEQAR